MTPLQTIRSQLGRLSEADQLTLLSWVIEGTRDMARSDDFVDAMQPVDRAFSDAHASLSALQREPECAGRGGIFSRRLVA